MRRLPVGGGASGFPAVTAAERQLNFGRQRRKLKFLVATGCINDDAEDIDACAERRCT